MRVVDVSHVVLIFNSLVVRLISSLWLELSIFESSRTVLPTILDVYILEAFFRRKKFEIELFFNCCNGDVSISSKIPAEVSSNPFIVSRKVMILFFEIGSCDKVNDPQSFYLPVDKLRKFSISKNIMIRCLVIPLFKLPIIFNISIY